MGSPDTECIKQVMEPICEARFSENSYGFRLNRCQEHAIASWQRNINQSKLHFVVGVDIKGLFDNVDHNKLMHQLWTIGIRDKELRALIYKTLKSQIKLLKGRLIYPEKGTPQGGNISPLLANVYLNELDHWVKSNWEENQISIQHAHTNKWNGKMIKNNGYKVMRNTDLKEMHIVRYTDDFCIFCCTKGEADRVKIAVIRWVAKRLKLEVSPEKTRVINVKRHKMEILGFEIKAKKR